METSVDDRSSVTFWGENFDIKLTFYGKISKDISIKCMSECEKLLDYLEKLVEKSKVRGVRE